VTADGRWTVRGVNHLDDRWELLNRRGAVVASIQWIRTLDHPQDAKTRIGAGLDGAHGDRQPPRCWTIPDTQPGPDRWEIRHNGELCGEITWHHPPPGVAPQVWIDRLLAGLNHVDRARRPLPPAPARPSRWAS